MKTISFKAILRLLFSAGMLFTASFVVSAQEGANMVKLGGNLLSFSTGDAPLPSLGENIALEHAFSKKFTVNFGMARNTQSFDVDFSSSSTLTLTSTVWSFVPEARYYFGSAFNGIYVGGNAGYHYMNLSLSSDRAIKSVAGASIFSLSGALGGAFHIAPDVSCNIGGNIGIAKESGVSEKLKLWSAFVTFGYQF